MQTEADRAELRERWYREGFFGTRPASSFVNPGAGPHRCLGSNLARLELQIAIEEWHKRIPNYRVVDPDLIETHAGGVAGMDRLQLAWEL
jgi:cytochrome P450